MADEQTAVEEAATGNPVEVTVVKFGQPQTVEIPEGATLSEVLEEAGVDPQSAVRFRGETVDGEERSIIGVLAGETILTGPPQVSHG